MYTTRTARKGMEETMRDSDLQPRYYINAALQAMEQAYAHNQDVRVGTQI